MDGDVDGPPRGCPAGAGFGHRTRLFRFRGSPAEGLHSSRCSTQSPSCGVWRRVATPPLLQQDPAQRSTATTQRTDRSTLQRTLEPAGSPVLRSSAQDRPRGRPIEADLWACLEAGLAPRLPHVRLWGPTRRLAANIQPRQPQRGMAVQGYAGPGGDAGALPTLSSGTPEGTPLSSSAARVLPANYHPRVLDSFVDGKVSPWHAVIGPA